MHELTGKVAVVTGAGGFLGAALARAFAGEGMSVVLADAHEQRLAAVHTSLRHAERPAIAVQADLAVEDGVRLLADRALDAFGAVHVLCNNIGINTRDRAVWTTTAADWEWALGANLLSMVHAIRIFVPFMLAQGVEGHIVNTASTGGLAGRPGTASYVTTKAAVIALTECLYHDLAAIDSKLGVSLLLPHIRGAVTQTERPPQFRGPNAEAQLAGERARFEERLRISEAQSGYQTPDEVAASVVRAVREGRFYVITRPDVAVGIAQARVDAMREGRAPTSAAGDWHRRHEEAGRR